MSCGVQGEPARTGGTVRLSFQSLQSRRNRLQRKELLPRPRSDRDAVGDRVAEQIIQRTGLRLCGEPGILEVALFFDLEVTSLDAGPHAKTPLDK